MTITPNKLIASQQIEVEDLYLNSTPKHPQVHCFNTDYGWHLLIADGSQIYNIPYELQQKIETISSENFQELDLLLKQYGLTAKTFINGQSLENPPLRSLSLAIAQKCNLGCTYCYAQEGGFGSPAQNMSWDVAKSAINRLLENAEIGESVNLSFLGGEPLINRDVIQKATELAVNLAQAKGVKLRLGITTNGTLVKPEDGAFFERYGFAVTVSLDGVGDVHNRLRPFKGGNGSYERIIENIQPLLSQQRRMQVTARVTVTPQNLDLRNTLDELIKMGFYSVGFSPMLSSPTGQEQMESSDLAVMLEQMIDCGQEFKRQTLIGKRYPFSNLTLALQQIHRGVHRPYPCGAGAGYMGVSANGNLWACHRFVEDEVGYMGNLTEGLDKTRQNQWLAQQQVDNQEPCKNCWARYLCGGGCHHEVIHRGRPSCDYIRGWLHFCLTTYIDLLEKRPDYFNSSGISSHAF